LLNYLVRFGWSYNDEEIFGIGDLIQKFDWERCGKGDGKFDQKKLTAVTFEHMKQKNLIDDETYAKNAASFLEARGLSADPV
jgi:glutamyl/glutaminyl-tRNA synthetase